MELTCHSCNESYTVDKKRYSRHLAVDRVTKMSTCPNCGERNSYNILQRNINENRIEKDLTNR